MNGMEVLEIKNEESKPTNVKEAVAAELAKHNTNQNTGIIQKQMSTEAKEQGNWYSLEELSQITGYTPDYIRKEVFSSMGEIPQAHSKLGGYHNSQKFYDEYILKAIKAYQLKAHGNMVNAEQANQTTANILSKAEQMMDLQTIAESGNVDAMKQFMNRMVAYTQIQAENKRLLEQTKQMEHALNYTAVIGWKKWSDLKKELAKNFEIFKHRISFKTVAAEAGLVKETDYAERIYGEDCFPTTMISESGIDKIYNCFDR